MSDIYEQVQKIICEQLDLELSQVQEDSSISYDLNADEAEFQALIQRLEKEFDIVIDKAEIEETWTVSDVAVYIDKHK